ncbi:MULTISPECIES: hypothetical protein [Nostoc]|uniref:Uncharacterized protein n=1 Tax=Nostoc paludosum FACHB-159 TaxID=2692908 RepID=A0ABR8KQM1_9NOSO|nr:MULTISPECIES: hypothetical protein [Nostoc]MBD2683578.1 hypothetical protein [Nostoc sp. FACHB-857]MBD2739897.1 hypothetical protein [Nostoc paludosum FACHB-159]
MMMSAKPIIARNDFTNAYGIVEIIPMAGDGILQIGKTDDGRWGISETYYKNSREYFMKSDCIPGLDSLKSLSECQEQISFILSQQ